MTTLAQIGFTTLGGSSILLVTMCLFGCAMRVRSPLIAPRATARPKSVIYSPYDTKRGNPWWGWIGWSLRLSYDTLLQGIPGTGTREAGLRGSLLRVNLDGIVLLRFHAVCLRVASVATVLFVTLLVPAFYSAQCYRGPATMLSNAAAAAAAAAQNNTSSTGDGVVDYYWPDDDNAVLFDLPDYCSQNFTYNLTDYERITIKNVPSIENQKWTQTIFLQQDGILWRLYATVICFAVVAAYLCHQLKQEWIQILAMRRVYYLEYDIWGERREELKQTMLLDDDDYDEANADPKQQPRAPERHLIERDPWIPHPEQRETVPNIALYSILVGGLPSLPEQAADSFNAQATIQFSKRESIDWQLSLTTTFFDHCVPNQPGFSSSIAAVTIIPSAQDLSVAWRKWYAAASKLRRLRFIRHQISLKRHYDIEEAVSELDENEIAKYGYGDDENNNNAVDEIDYGYGDDGPSPTNGTTTPVVRRSIPDTTSVDYGYGDDDANDNAPGGLSITTSYDNTPGNDVVVTKQVDFGYEPAVPDHAAAGSAAQQPTPRDIYSVAKNRNYFHKVLGAQDDDDQDHIYSSNEFGPEQAAVYAREFAQAAAPCCPVGCMEGRIRRAGIDQLLELERITAMEVHEANLDLRAARRRATRADTVFTQRQSTLVHAHSCIQVGVQEGGEGKSPEALDEDAEIEDLIPLEVKRQKLLSRYNRKQSMDYALESDKEQRVARLNQLENVVPGDLGLEAQLFKKTADQHKRTPSLSNGPPTTNNTSMRTKHHRKTPSLDGIEYPMHIATEAHLTSDSDGSASGSGHRVKPVLTTASRLSNIKENNSCMSSVGDLDVVDEINTSSAHWAQVETIITEANENIDMQNQPIPDGQWKLPNIRKLFSIKETGKEIGKWAQQQSMDAVDNLARESTYAVVTFTSRQAAVAARSCLADGRGAGRWQTLKEIPIPPLSDAAPADLVTFRNCCRPVTLSINERQKNVRNYMYVFVCVDFEQGKHVSRKMHKIHRQLLLTIHSAYRAMTLLAAMYTFYTIPLTAAAQLIDPKDLEKLIPSIEGFGEGNRQRLVNLLSGLTTALIWSTFFALCPIFFKVSLQSFVLPAHVLIRSIPFRSPCRQLHTSAPRQRVWPMPSLRPCNTTGGSWC